ncbi:MAG TPA: serine--tRNA ligase [Patescibacteria group bacterium]|nr:serine--tRNA ligase [Patescibacteria group bacterium]
MLDLKFIRENPEKVAEGAASKNIEVPVEEILRLDEEVRALSRQLQELYTERNRAAKERDIEGGKEIKAEVGSLEARLKELEEKLKNYLYAIPNMPAADVKVGKNEEENEVVKTVGDIPNFDFKPRDHVELGQILDIIDIDRAAKVAGSRFTYLKNEGVLLEFALIQFALNTLMHDGFTPVIPPEIIKTEVMKRVGYMEHGGAEDMFHIEKDGLTLIGTGEHSTVAMHMDETFLERDLPKRYVAFSSSFRREAGSYGKDTRGILRVHQFDKVELVSYVAPEQDEAEQKHLLAIEEKFFNDLKIPYQVVKMCTGDLGFVQARKFDIEAWIPTQNKYREMTSASTLTDFQARNLNIKFARGAEKSFVHTLNATGFAIGRTLIAILENYQQEDGSVVVPEVLRKYINLDVISPKRN